MPFRACIGASGALHHVIGRGIETPGGNGRTEEPEDSRWEQIVIKSRGVPLLRSTSILPGSIYRHPETGGKRKKLTLALHQSYRNSPAVRSSGAMMGYSFLTIFLHDSCSLPICEDDIALVFCNYEVYVDSFGHFPGTAAALCSCAKSRTLLTNSGRFRAPRSPECVAPSITTSLSSFQTFLRALAESAFLSRLPTTTCVGTRTAANCSSDTADSPYVRNKAA